MRTRQFANVERIRSKERRLLEVLRRQEQQRVLSAFPKGILKNTPLSFTASIGGTTVTINAPLLAVVDVPQTTWVVDQGSPQDPTGGFADVVIEPGRQIGSLKSSQTISMAGKAANTYWVYVDHVLEEENPETRNPPGKYTDGGGVFTEHRAFYGYGSTTPNADGEPIPRNDYDASLSGQTVSEKVDRLEVKVVTKQGFNPGSATGTPLVEIGWDGNAITSTYTIAHVINFDQQVSDIKSQLTRIQALEALTGTGVGGHERRLDDAEDRLGDLESLTGDVPGGHERRLDSAEGRLTTVEGRATTVEGRATSLESRATSLEAATTDSAILQAAKNASPGNVLDAGSLLGLKVRAIVEHTLTGSLGAQSNETITITASGKGIKSGDWAMVMTDNASPQLQFRARVSSDNQVRLLIWNDDSASVSYNGTYKFIVFVG